MSKELIQAELLKKNTDWFLISNIAKDIYNKERETNSLKFKKNALNIIRVGEYCHHDISYELKSCFDGDDYQYLIIDDLVRFNRWIKSNPDLSDKYHIVITSNPKTHTNAISKGIECNVYSSLVKNKYKEDIPTTLILKGVDINIKFETGNLRSELRNLTLESLI